MKPLQIAILTVLIVLWNESAGFPLGGDHGPVGKTSLRDNMSAALRKLINRRDRVHGYFVNSEDIFFYAGNTEALNQFLTGFAKLKNTTLTIAINQRLTHAASPWDKAKRKTVANWRLYCAPYDVQAWSAELEKQLKTAGENRSLDALRKRLKSITDGPQVARVQIRVGGDIELNKLQIPHRIKLTLIDNKQQVSPTIRAFVLRHETSRAQQTDR